MLDSQVGFDSLSYDRIGFSFHIVSCVFTPGNKQVVMKMKECYGIFSSSSIDKIKIR